MRWTIFLLMCGLTGVRATDTLVVRNARLLSMAEGLSQGYVFSSLQDRYGFTWFCTKDGLNRFDGSRFLTFNHDPSDPGSMRANGVTSLYEDDAGILWIQYYGSGLDVYMRSWDVFIHAEELFSECGFTGNEEIKWITSDRPGRYWCQTNEGLYRFEVRLRDKPLRYTGNSASGRFRSMYESRGALVVGKSHRLFDRGPDSHLFKDHRGRHFITVQRHIYPLDFDSPDVYEEELLPDLFRPGSEEYFYISIVCNSEVTYFIFEDQAWRYNSEPRKGELLRLPFRYISSQQGLHLDAHNRLLGLDQSTHLTSYHTITGEALVYRFELPDGNLLVPSSLSTVLIDEQDNIWLGSTGYGVLLFHAFRERFRYASPGKGLNSSLYAIREDRGGDLLIGVHKGIFRFDRQTGRFTSLLSRSPLSRYLTDTNMGRDVYVDSGNGYWLVQGARLLRYEPVKKKLTTVFEHETGARYSELFPLVPDTFGWLWMSTYDSLFAWSVQDRQLVVRLPLPLQRKPGYTPTSVHSILPDSGKVWLATVDGLWVLDRKRGTWKGYHYEAGVSNGPGAEQLFWILRDLHHPDILWLGSNGGGLNRFSIRDEHFTRITTKDGLPNNVVYAVLQDASGRLWMSTNRGICRYDPNSHSVVTYTVTDGLQDNEFNRYSAWQASDGTMYFGGVNGLTWFNPLAIGNQDEAPDVVITGLLGVSGPLSDAEGWRVDPITAETIVLSHRDVLLRVTFTALESFAPDRLRYRYRLRGLNEDWIDLGNSRELVFTELPTGKYILEIVAVTAEGNTSPHPRQVHIKVHPAWWGTWAFRIALFVFAGLLIFLGYRWRMRRVVELQRIRDHIARDLHDEIGSSLSSIAIYSKVIMDSESGSIREMTPVLQRIRDTSQRMMESMSDIVWAINSSNDSPEQVVQRMRSLAVELTEARGLSLHFHADPFPAHMRLGMDERRNLYLVFKEAVNNSIKYSGAPDLSISLRVHSDQIELTVHDSGKGFDPAAVRPGNGLHNMRTRAEMLDGELDIHSAPSQGTTIKLRFR